MLLIHFPQSSRKYGHIVEEQLKYQLSELRDNFLWQLTYGYEYLEEHKVPMYKLADDDKFASALTDSKETFEKYYNKIMNARMNSRRCYGF